MIIDADASDGVDLPAPRSRFLVGPRFAPGPLPAAKRRRAASGAAKGALVGGLVALAVLAALSMPLVAALIEPQRGERLPEAPRPRPARSAAVATPAPAVPEPVAEPVAAEPPPVAEPAPAASLARDPASSTSTLGLHSLPTLTQQAEDIDMEPEAAPPPVAAKPIQRTSAQRRPAPPKP